MLLSLVSIPEELVDTEVGVGAIAETHRSGGTADLLEKEAVHKVARVNPAVLLY